MEENGNVGADVASENGVLLEQTTNNEDTVLDMEPRSELMAENGIDFDPNGIYKCTQFMLLPAWFTLPIYRAVVVVCADECMLHGL